MQNVKNMKYEVKMRKGRSCDKEYKMWKINAKYKSMKYEVRMREGRSCDINHLSPLSAPPKMSFFTRRTDCQLSIFREKFRSNINIGWLTDITQSLPSQKRAICWFLNSNTNFVFVARLVMEDGLGKASETSLQIITSEWWWGLSQWRVGWISPRQRIIVEGPFECEIMFRIREVGL